jgi:CheY-like chemotaxis protein
VKNLGNESSVGYVLAVDDDENMLRFMETYLTHLGIRVLFASMSEMVFPLLVEHGEQVALIFLDLAMPGLDGFQIATTIRGDSRFSVIPIVLITARADSFILSRAQELGIDQVLGKPFHPWDLRNVLAAYQLLLP